METYEPLKSPEIQRDENGRFDRHGKTLAKTTKKTGLVKNNKEQRHAGFQPGQSGNPAGRPAGSKNKTTLALREAILSALDKVGGDQYLARLAVENSSAFASLLARVLPHTLAAAPESDGGGKMVFERVICWPDGHREIEGKTPKQLPAPPDAGAT